MPYQPDDNRHPHLPLYAENVNPDRRKRPSPPAPPPGRGGRSRFAGELRDQLADIEEEVAVRSAPPAGIQPHLVFRVPLSGNAASQQIADKLTRLGITVVSIESDKAIIAFSEDGDLSQFRQAVATYERGPHTNPVTGEPYASTQWDVLEYIEVAQMRVWSPRDRIGARLAATIGAMGDAIVPEQMYVLDVELWRK